MRWSRTAGKQDGRCYKATVNETETMAGASPPEDRRFLRASRPDQQTPDSHAFGVRDLLTKSLYALKKRQSMSTADLKFPMPRSGHSPRGHQVKIRY